MVRSQRLPMQLRANVTSCAASMPFADCLGRCKQRQHARLDVEVEHAAGANDQRRDAFALRSLPVHPAETCRMKVPEQQSIFAVCQRRSQMAREILLQYASRTSVPSKAEVHALEHDVDAQSEHRHCQSGHLIVLSGLNRKPSFFNALSPCIALKNSTLPGVEASNVQLFAGAAGSRIPDRA